MMELVWFWDARLPIPECGQWAIDPIPHVVVHNAFPSTLKLPELFWQNFNESSLTSSKSIFDT